MDLWHMQRNRLDVLAAHEHNSQAAVPAMLWTRIHNYALTARERRGNEMKIDVQAIVDRRNATLKAMVTRFLSWPLPPDFNPDDGISFTPPVYWPTGTNLFTAEQATAMFKHCVPPVCYGLDDCSSQTLANCSWSDTCGSPNRARAQEE